MERMAVGIDVGGERKGFHAVALQGQVIAGQFASADPASIADWCRALGAQAVGVDAPCRWSATGGSRLAERELMKAGVACFSSPRREVAIAHPRNYYGWMLRGEALFAELEKSHRLFDGLTGSVPGPVCFETFPQAIACVLAGERVPARDKGVIRRRLLSEAGIDLATLSHIDWVDAALCALAARACLAGEIRAYGNAAEGFIVVPE
jgi:predicted nuclease with RNAse H fold